MNELINVPKAKGNDIYGEVVEDGIHIYNAALDPHDNSLYNKITMLRLPFKHTTPEQAQSLSRMAQDIAWAISRARDVGYNHAQNDASQWIGAILPRS